MTIHTFLHMRLYLRKNAAQYLKPVNTGSVWVTITKNTGGNLLTLSLRAMFGSQGPSTYIQYFIMYSIPYSKVVQSTLSVYSFDDQKRYRVASTPVLLPDKKTHLILISTFSISNISYVFLAFVFSEIFVSISTETYYFLSVVIRLGYDITGRWRCSFFYLNSKQSFNSLQVFFQAMSPRD